MKEFSEYKSRNIQKQYYESNANLDIIKSMFIFGNIFSFLSKNKKLGILIYNKKYQKNLYLDIESYKNVSGKYLIGEKTGVGKEYKLNTNTLIFEGYYFKGKKHGSGKEYYDTGELKFEGEYYNGIKTKGIGYDNKGNIILSIDNNGIGREYNYKKYIKELSFEGEYINGERYGKGKEYYSDGGLKFEGEYKKGERYGKGKEYYSGGGLKFEGEFINGKRSGNGKEYYDFQAFIVLKKTIIDKKFKKFPKTFKILLCDYFNRKTNSKEENNYNKFLKFECYYHDGHIIGKVKNYFNGVLLNEKNGIDNY